MFSSIAPGFSFPSAPATIRRRLLVAAGALGAASLLSCGGNGTSNTNAVPPTLTVTPASISLTAGAASQSASLLLTAPAGSGAAIVTVSSLPTGVTITPSTLSLTPAVPLPISFTASSSAAASTATVTFSTMVGAQTVNAQTSLSVQPAPQQDFSLSVTPASTTLVANGTPVSLSLLATPQNGFAANVPVTMSGLPPGVTAQPSTVTLMPGSPATVMLTAAPGTSPESGTVTFTGTSGSLTHTASLALTVTAPPATADFTLTLAPQSLTVAPGTGQTVQVTATALNGFTAATTVTLSGLPTGVTSTPTSLTLAPGIAQTVTLTAANTAAATTETVVFTGTSGSLTHTANLALTVAPTGTSVTTYHNDNARDGWNSSETVLTPQTVNTTTFGKLRELPVDGKVDAQPLYVSNLSIAGQTHNVLITVTEHGTAYAFDADAGSELWHTSTLGPNETTSDDHGCTLITPEIGITGTPVIDRGYGTNGAVFLVAMSKDSQGAYHQRLHALDLTTGAPLAGSPSEIQATYPGNGYGSSNGVQVFAPGQYMERVGLLLMNGQIYLAWASHCDQDPFTGWLMAYSESTLQQTGVFNMTPNGPSTPHYANGEGAVWMSGAGLGGDGQGNVYFLDANGTFDATLDGNHFPSLGDFGNAFLKISTTGNKLAVADYFATHNTLIQSPADQDLGSGGVLLLPDLVDAGGVTRSLAVGAGKDRNIYVVDRTNMGKYNGRTNTMYQEVSNALSGGVFSAPAFFNNTVYFAAFNDSLKAFPVTQALLATTAASQSTNTFSFPGATASISSNGTQNGIVWAIETQSGAGVLHAYDATNVASELYNSNQASGSRDHFPYSKFMAPTIANGKVFVGTPDSVAIFGMLP